MGKGSGFSCAFCAFLRPCQNWMVAPHRRHLTATRYPSTLVLDLPQGQSAWPTIRFVSASTRTFPSTLRPHSQRWTYLSSERGGLARRASIFPSFGQRHSYISRSPLLVIGESRDYAGPERDHSGGLKKKIGLRAVFMRF